MSLEAYFLFIFISVSAFNEDLHVKHYSIVESGVDEKVPARKYICFSLLFVGTNNFQVRFRITVPIVVQNLMVILLWSSQTTLRPMLLMLSLH